MLNYLWGFMILIGIVAGALNGRIAEVGMAAVDSSKEAVTLCLTMLGVMSFWMGLMEVGSAAGIIDSLTRKLRPVIRFLFPNVPKDHPANVYIASNIIANVLGLGWAATPAGLKAMEELSGLEEERRKEENGEKPGTAKEKKKKGRYVPAVPQGTASNEMCTFLIINISSLQLIPVNIIAYRSQYGSVNPAAIVGAGIVATAVSTFVAVVYCKVKDMGHRPSG